MAANVGALNGTYTWTSRSSETQIVFQMIQGIVSATLFTKGSDGQFHSKYTVGERDITVETRNTMELMRGLQQQTFGFTALTNAQKQAVLASLASRNIEVENRLPSGGSFNILALP